MIMIHKVQNDQSQFTMISHSMNKLSFSGAFLALMGFRLGKAGVAGVAGVVAGVTGVGIT
jgi:hypothetical protein